MDQRFLDVVDDLARQAADHDAAEPDRLRRYRVLDREAGRLLRTLALALRAKTIVEIGTSVGMSALWLADAARLTSGHVTSYDTDPQAARTAATTLTRAGLTDHVTFTTADGGQALSTLRDESVDLLFLDAERTEYPTWWPHPLRVLHPGAALVIDNALSHPEELAPFRALLEHSDALDTTLIEIGKGELITLRL